jgi:hypothetical protein
MNWAVNKAWKDAPYELRYIKKDGTFFELPWPVRFDVTPPEYIWMDGDKFSKWCCENMVPWFIPVSEPANPK